MRNREIEAEMYRLAVELIEKRYPTGWGGAGVVHTSAGNYYTSVSIDTANASAVVCIELGAMLEAHKFNEKVTHCMCLIRDDENAPYRVLSPCGICQERLRFWGEDVQVAVTNREEKIKFVELRELQPYHWTLAYPPEELEHWEGEA
jgi:cytidine deaminase